MQVTIRNNTFVDLNPEGGLISIGAGEWAAPQFPSLSMDPVLLI